MRIYPVFLPLSGCSHRCVFCRQEGIAPDPDGAFQYLNGILPSVGEGEIAFYGGSFTLLPPDEQSAYLRGAARMVATGRASGIRVSTRPDALEEKSVDLLAKGGVTTVEIGCQSFSAEVLYRSGRGHGPDEAAASVPRLRKAGLKVGLQLMPGLPGGDRREAVDSLRTALSLCPDFLRIYPATVFRGTPLETALRSGEYRPLDLEEGVDLCAELLWRCRIAHVPVIRLGLQGTPALEEDLLAGPWHPAFGQLVRSRLWLRALVAGSSLTGSMEARVHPADRADALGHRRENLLRLRHRFGEFTVIPEPKAVRDTIFFGSREFTLDALSAYED